VFIDKRHIQGLRSEKEKKENIFSWNKKVSFANVISSSNGIIGKIIVE